MGNLFELAERQLINEKNNRRRKKYTLLDVIDYAVMIRQHLDYQVRGEAISRAKRRK